MGIYQNFGLKKIVNASGKMTALGASAVHPKVAGAISEAAMDYVDIQELMVAAGKTIATVTGAEDGCPTSGAAAGIAISVAAVIAGTNLTRIEKLPFSDGLKNEILIQKGHAVHFGASVTQMISLGGGKVIEAGQANHVEKDHLIHSVTDQTAALFYVKSHHAVQKGMQSLETMISIAKERVIPVIVDAAAEEDLRKYINMGADLVIYSGGKAIEGPTSGFICGRSHLIEACRAQYQGIGRAMKVGKEAVVGLLTALKRYESREDLSQEQKQRMLRLVEQIKGMAGIEGRVVQDEAGREIYRAELRIDSEKFGMSACELIRHLESGDPAIYTRNHYANTGMIYIDPRPLLPGQEQLIIKRIKEIAGLIRKPACRKNGAGGETDGD
ncbi:DgaE family pyridoxal phosphate-dependent ammonia lyase [Paenactinomyces guangxiensis]|uniref:DgaE family pyridoxal phosphate-dependent ammonia lyase n=1 Tax=Paenactinomyces guangxiensis TaxID=1490290 RepID=A0A7W1WPW8_9BACL|nr:DgaE family pyridoxal phosphate-dependent ammonia lyase [Paenactinomyces guangxiensis]MBA4493898.1 DgaE family pyridoxal phosphate-dependent ammonia lyase [Paenactinomyces guangxiensis]MBH8591364.1 DgaE family pyridoxal phosphate-dependent ammonia lyase [Paenactinomyces guangxiensis]